MLDEQILTRRSDVALAQNWLTSGEGSRISDFALQSTRGQKMTPDSKYEMVLFVPCS